MDQKRCLTAAYSAEKITKNSKKIPSKFGNGWCISLIFEGLVRQADGWQGSSGIVRQRRGIDNVQPSIG